jgi:hypothetical protein
MAYAQHFGLSRNSPLNTHTKYHCGEDSKNSAGECVGWEYYQDEEKRDTEKNQANEDLYNLKGPLTDDQQTKRDMMMISAVSKGEKEWGKDGKNWNTYPLKERPNGWSLANAKGPDGQDQGNTFAEEDLNKAQKAVELRDKQDKLGVTKDEDGNKIAWNDNERNPDGGYKQGFDKDGKEVHNSRGDKMFLGDKDITEEYYKTHNRAGGKNQTFSNQLDYVQDGLGVLGFTPGYGAFADGANALLSGFRGVGSLLGAKSEGTTTGGHFKNMIKNGMYAVPVAGDALALSKVNKFKKYLPTTKGMTNWTKGNNIVTRNIGKTNKTKFNYNPQPISGAAKNWESKGKNLFRGVAGFATGKNYNKFGQGVETVLGKNKFADVVKMGTSSKAFWGKPQDALNTLQDGGNLLTEAGNQGMDSIKNAFGGVDYSNFDTGGFLDGKNKNKGVAAKAGTLVSTTKKVDTNPSKVTSIIDQNNNKSNAEVI